MKDLLRIAWRNIGRNKRRSILSAAAVAFAVAVLCFCLALQKGSYATMINNTVRAGTGHLQIQQRGYWPDRTLSQKLNDPDRILSLLHGLPHLVGVAPRVTATALVSRKDRTFGALVLGVDPARERQVSTLAAVVRRGRYLSDDDPAGALVGQALARNLGVALGDEIVFLGQGADGSIAAGRLTVRGVVESGIGDLDRVTLAAPLRTVQEAFSLPEAVSEISVLLDLDRSRPLATRGIVERLRQAGRTNAVVLDWPTLLPGVEETIQLDWYSGLIVYALLVLVVGFGIANTFLMAFIERIPEFGMLLALGLTPRRLFLMVYAESVFLTSLGVVAGVVLGVATVAYFERVGINFGQSSEALMRQYGLDPVIHPQLSVFVVVLALGIVLATALLLALYPARKAILLEPVPAMRQR
jgi:putative ABC transport system permease protein